MTYRASSRLHLRKVSTRLNPFISLILGTALLVALTQSGCTGSTGAGSTSSNPANPTPSITTQPASLAVVVGQTATFSVVASGTAPLSYQWSKNGTVINGGTSANYTTPATTASD